MVGMVCFPVLKLKLLMRAMYDQGIAKKVNGGDDNASEMLLLPLNEMHQRCYYYHLMNYIHNSFINNNRS
jgi:hypothetical protein